MYPGYVPYCWRNQTLQAFINGQEWKQGGANGALGGAPSRKKVLVSWFIYPSDYG